MYEFWKGEEGKKGVSVLKQGKRKENARPLSLSSFTHLGSHCCLRPCPWRGCRSRRPCAVAWEGPGTAAAAADGAGGEEEDKAVAAAVDIEEEGSLAAAAAAEVCDDEKKRIGVLGSRGNEAREHGIDKQDSRAPRDECLQRSELEKGTLRRKKSRGHEKYRAPSFRNAQFTSIRCCLALRTVVHGVADLLGTVPWGAAEQSSPEARAAHRKLRSRQGHQTRGHHFLACLRGSRRSLAAARKPAAAGRKAAAGSLKARGADYPASRRTEEAAQPRPTVLVAHRSLF